MRRLWPDIVEAVKSRRRLTWIHLTQHAQVVAVDGTTLTLGFSNAGARESFDGGGSAEIVRQAAIDVVGSDWKVETIVDPGAQPAATQSPVTPAPMPEPTVAVEPPAEVSTSSTGVASPSADPPRSRRPARRSSRPVLPAETPSTTRAPPPTRRPIPTTMTSTPPVSPAPSCSSSTSAPR